MSTITEQAPTTAPRLDHGNGADRDRFSHIIFKRDHLAGYVGGNEVEALCGKKWTPNADPERFPLCPTCKDIAEAAGAKIPTG